MITEEVTRGLEDIIKARILDVRCRWRWRADMDESLAVGVTRSEAEFFSGL